MANVSSALRGIAALPNGTTYRTALCWICALTAFALGVASYVCGSRHGFDRWMPEPIEYENMKIAAALSERYYGLERGGLILKPVVEALRANGMTQFRQYLDPLGLKFPENESDPVTMDKALEKATQLGRLPLSGTIFTDLLAVQPNDLGAVNFYKWAFDIFGLHVNSFFRLYFFDPFCFDSAFRCSVFSKIAEALTLLIGAAATHLFAQSFFLGLPAADVFQVSTPYSQRFIAVLGIISALHLALTIVRPPRFSVRTGLAFAGQVAIVFFVYTIRSSAEWQILWPISLLLGALFLLLLNIWVILRWWPVRLVPIEPLGRVIGWPAPALVALVIGLTVLTSSQQDPVYRFSDEALPHHMFWHSVVHSFALHPEWERRFGADLAARNDGHASSDQLPFAMATDWLEDNYGLPKEYMLSSTFGWRYRTTERILQSVLTEFALQHPRFILELQLYYKPRMFWNSFVDWNANTVKGLDGWA